MQDECDNNYPNGIEIGDVAVTGGYGLKCKKVYHGTLPKWSDKSKNAIIIIFYILKGKSNATGGNIIFAWLNDVLMMSLLEMSN